MRIEAEHKTFGWSYDVLQMFLQEKEAWKTLKAWIDVVAEVPFTEEAGGPMGVQQRSGVVQGLQRKGSSVGMRIDVS